MNEIIEKENVENMIYKINGKEVMLDSDLARLYQVETKRINEAVRRNKEKFPERFCWIVNDDDFINLRSHFSTSSLEVNNYGGRRYNPRVFTEQGVYMLATILKSDVATQVTIAIMDTFVKMKHYINYNNSFLPNKILLLEDRVDNNTKRINELFDKFDPKVITKNYLFFDGEFYDAYSLFIEILESSKEEIILIDNYASKELLDMLKNIKRNIIIVSNNIDETLKSKYESQYRNVKFINNNTFHDRFIIIDRIKLYSCGSSFKDIGKKCFAINKIDSKELIDNLINKIFTL